AKIRVEVELLADGQEPPLGPLLVGHVVPLGAADGAEEDRVRAAAELERAGSERLAGRVDRGAAHEAALELEHGARALADGPEHPNGLGGHFLTDPISRQNRDPICRHRPTSRMCGGLAADLPASAYGDSLPTSSAGAGCVRPTSTRRTGPESA